MTRVYTWNREDIFSRIRNALGRAIRDSSHSGARRERERETVSVISNFLTKPCPLLAQVCTFDLEDSVEGNKAIFLGVFTVALNLIAVQ